MIKGTTEQGFKFKIKESALDNIELLEVLADMDDGQAQKLPKAIELLIGAHQKQKLYDFCREEGGAVPISKVAEVFAEILTSSENLKK